MDPAADNRKNTFWLPDWAAVWQAVLQVRDLKQQRLLRLMLLEDAFDKTSHLITDIAQALKVETRTVRYWRAQALANPSLRRRLHEIVHTDTRLLPELRRLKGSWRDVDGIPHALPIWRNFWPVQLPTLVVDTLALAYSFDEDTGDITYARAWSSDSGRAIGFGAGIEAERQPRRSRTDYTRRDWVWYPERQTDMAWRREPLTILGPSTPWTVLPAIGEGIPVPSPPRTFLARGRQPRWGGEMHQTIPRPTPLALHDKSTHPETLWRKLPRYSGPYRWRSKWTTVDRARGCRYMSGVPSTKREHPHKSAAPLVTSLIMMRRKVKGVWVRPYAVRKEPCPYGWWRLWQERRAREAAQARAEAVAWRESVAADKRRWAAYDQMAKKGVGQPLCECCRSARI